MTLCIAAFGREGWDENREPQVAVVMCSDKRVENDWTGSETGFKITKIGKNWSAMLAGSVPRASELISIYVSELGDRCLASSETLDVLREPPKRLKRNLVEQYVQAKLALSYHELLEKGPDSLPSSLFESIMNDVSRISIGCELLLIPMLEQQRKHLYLVGNDGSVTTSDNFCAIGTGAINAESWLHYRAHTSATDLRQTIWMVLEAKKFSENSPAVGKKLDLTIMRSDGTFLFCMDDKCADRVWKKTGPKNIGSIGLDLEKGFQSVEWEKLTP